MRVAVYAGSFDPFTKGHLTVLRGAVKAFDKVIIGVGLNVSKKSLFNEQERRDIIHEYLDEAQFRVRPMVVTFDGLLIHFCQRLLTEPVLLGDSTSLPDSVSIVRGLRAVSDFESEMGIADANRRLDPRFPTLFIPTEADMAFVSSSVVKEIAHHSQNPKLLEPYVIPRVAERLCAKWATVT